MYLLNSLIDEANRADIDGDQRRLMRVMQSIEERARYLTERAWADYNRNGAARALRP